LAQGMRNKLILLHLRNLSKYIPYTRHRVKTAEILQSKIETGYVYR